LVTLSEDCLKAAPENHTLRLLREFREEFREFGRRADKSFAQIQERFNSLQQAMLVESVLGRYATPRPKSGFPPLSRH